MNSLQNFILEHERNPFYIAAKQSLSNETVSNDIQDAIIRDIFKKNDEYDLMYPLVFNLKVPFNFIKNYQNEIKEMDNEKLNKKIFKTLVEQKDKTNLYKAFNIYLDRDTFYNALDSADGNKIAYTYQAFISKAKESLFDKYSYPFPYSVSISNNEKGMDNVVKKLNLSLLSNISSIFRYGHLQSSKTIAEAFKDDMMYLLDNYPSKDGYIKELSDNIFKMHPEIIYHLREKFNFSLNRQFSIDYLIHNAENLNEKQFQFFANSFFKNNIDSDIISSFVKEKNIYINGTEQFVKNINNFDMVYKNLNLKTGLKYG